MPSFGNKMFKILFLLALFTSLESFANLDEFMFKRNLKRDSIKCDLKTELKIGDYSIKGSIHYMDSIRGHYHYDVLKTQEQIVLSTKIFFRKVRNEQIAYDEIDYLTVLEKVKWAQTYWNSQVPDDLNLKFKFIVVDKKEEAYFKPALVKKLIRGPYYAGWSTFWHPIVIAHEIGHMFGLDDEYENSPLGASSDLCDADSLMCTNAPGSILKPYHFEVILRRLSCL